MDVKYMSIGCFSLAKKIYVAYISKQELTSKNNIDIKNHSINF